jgi:hypothetical protein
MLQAAATTHDIGFLARKLIHRTSQSWGLSTFLPHPNKD